MPHKVVAINHQTFMSGGEATKQVFRFSKVYKTNPSQRFLVKPIALMFFTADKEDPEPHIFVLKGLGEFNGELNIQTGTPSTSGNTQSQVNKTFLGVVGGGMPNSGTNQGASNSVEAPTFLVKDIPLNDFTIESIHPDNTASESADFLVHFEIQTIEDY